MAQRYIENLIFRRPKQRYFRRAFNLPFLVIFIFAVVLSVAPISTLLPLITLPKAYLAVQQQPHSNVIDGVNYSDILEDVRSDRSDLPSQIVGLESDYGYSEPMSSPTATIVDRTSELSDILKRAAHLHGNPPTRGKYVLFRSIGNDLPPRHVQGQSFNNVKFILDNEKLLPDLDVRWYLNRIVDPDEQIRIVNLLIERKQTFVIDVFNLTNYAKVDFRLRRLYDYDDVLRSPKFQKSDEKFGKRIRSWNIIFEPKNQFIIHNNQARNAMLELGYQTGATYVLPWDGNCFLNRAAWSNITRMVDRIARSPHNISSHLYFYVPMARMSIDNEALKNDSYVPLSMREEPQIIFHRNASAWFDETKPYSFRPKVDLLWRLRVPQFQYKSKNGTIMPDVMSYKQVKDVPGYDSVRPVGWTARLFSGQTRLEKSKSAWLRGMSRSNGVELISARASLASAERFFNYSRWNTLMMYDLSVLRSQLVAYKQGAVPVNVQRSIERAISAAGRAPPSPGISENDTGAFGSHIIATAIAALLHEGGNQFAESGASTVRKWFIDESQIRANSLHAPKSLLHICVALDATRLLHNAGVLLDADMQSIAVWTAILSESLEKSQHWSDIYYRQDTDALLFEAGAACINSFTGLFHLVLRHTGLARLRLHEQLGDNSTFVEQEGPHGLMAWVWIALIGDRIGVNVWSHRSENERGLPWMQIAFEKMLRNISRNRDAETQRIASWLFTVARQKFPDANWFMIWYPPANYSEETALADENLDTSGTVVPYLSLGWS